MPRQLKILAFAPLWCAIVFGPIQAAGQPSSFCRIAQVISVDLIEVSLDAKLLPVRLIGVDPPAPDQTENGHALESAQTLTGNQVWLEYDAQARRGTGALLAYVWLAQPLDDSEPEIRAKMLNARILVEGRARHRPDPPNAKYAALFEKLQAEAKAAGRGIWRGVGSAPAAPPAVDPVVFITEAGTKYHREGCRYLGKSKTAIGLAEAKARGYTPCGVCKPPG